jgi:hypothetical protein
LRALLSVALAVLVLAATGGYLWLRGADDSAGFDRGRNGIWLDIEWVNEPHGDAEIAALCRDLADDGFRYAYVYANSVEATGEPDRDTFPYAKRFVDVAKRSQPDLRLIAWVGVVNAVRGQGKVPIGEPAVQANIAAFAGELTREVGFDGVQLNVEPLPNGNGDYLALLAEVREAIGPEKLLGVAGHKWAPDLVPLVERYSSYWKSGYYRQVAALVDQVAVMTYDSYAPTADAFRLFQREQTLGVLGAVAGTDVEILIGVPTYHEPRPNHNPRAENVETGLRGVADALARLPDGGRKPFAGVAVYAHWETDEAEWARYRALWRGQR